VLTRSRVRPGHPVRHGHDLGRHEIVNNDNDAGAKAQGVPVAA
jgi:hypothetical protein